MVFDSASRTCCQRRPRPTLPELRNNALDAISADNRACISDPDRVGNGSRAAERGKSGTDRLYLR